MINHARDEAKEQYINEFLGDHGLAIEEGLEED